VYGWSAVRRARDDARRARRDRDAPDATATRPTRPRRTRRDRDASDATALRTKIFASALGIFGIIVGITGERVVVVEDSQCACSVL
jgi:hypothetical protein